MTNSVISGMLPELTRVLIDGMRVECGTAAQIAAHLGPDVTDDLVRRWGERGLIERYHRPGRGRGVTWFRLDQAAAVERDKRLSTRGRRRRLDMAAALA